MAKIGEGDSRWIVNDRTDGKNCGNWHWEEKDLSAITHDALREKFKGMVLCENRGGLSVTLKEVSDISGDVSVAQRKGKIMCYFDIKFTIKYTSTLDGEAGKGEGKIVVPEIDHDCFMDDFELNVSSTDTKPASKKAEDFVRAEGRKQIRDVVRSYFSALFEQYNVGKMLSKIGPAAGSTASAGPIAAGTPASTSGSTPITSSPAVTIPAGPTTPAASKTKTSAPQVKSKATLTWKLEWRCPAEELWQVLTDAGRASHYTRAPAKIDAQPSGTFEYLGGLITGYYVEVTPYQKLVMQWRLSSWQAGQLSTVIMSITREEAGVCRLEFAQAGIPEGEYDRVRDGWLRNFWDPIKAVFGFTYDVIE
jgi:activator of HSP90 ATPase